jgi:hypothetical protein
MQTVNLFSFNGVEKHNIYSSFTYLCDSQVCNFPHIFSCLVSHNVYVCLDILAINEQEAGGMEAASEGHRGVDGPPPTSPRASKTCQTFCAG